MCHPTVVCIMTITSGIALSRVLLHARDARPARPVFRLPGVQHQPDPDDQQARRGDPRRPEPLLEEHGPDGRADDDRRLPQGRDGCQLGLGLGPQDQAVGRHGQRRAEQARGGERPEQGDRPPRQRPTA